MFILFGTFHYQKTVYMFNHCDTFKKDQQNPTVSSPHSRGQKVSSCLVHVVLRVAKPRSDRGNHKAGLANLLREGAVIQEIGFQPEGVETLRSS